MKIATAMGIVVLAGLLASPAFARLGETRDQVLARYGTPTETVDLGRIESLHFKKGAFTVCVEIAKDADRAVQMALPGLWGENVLARA